MGRDEHGRFSLRRGAVGLLCALAASLLVAAPASADDCPPIQDKPEATPHVDYDGVQRLTYCYGPVTVQPGQNIIRLNPTRLFPQVPGYITRFDPELVYTDGSVPRVDVLHLHHAVWLVNYNPQFAAGEEKSIVQLPFGFGWRSTPQDSWYLNDMIHDLVGKPASVYIVWRLDFVPDTAPAAPLMRTVRTKWMDVAGLSFYPVFNALRKWGHKGRYTFPDQAPLRELSHVGLAQTWYIDHPVTLIGTVGHLHPGGLKTGLRVFRNGKSRRLFASRAHYYEPAGAVSWDVSMGATPPAWRVLMKPGDTLSVHTTYDTRRADWYEGMGIMPVAVYDGADVGGFDPFSKALPQKGVFTHGHLAENDNHGGARRRLPDPRLLPNGPSAFGPIGIDEYQYEQGDFDGIGRAANPPTVRPGGRISFLNEDAVPSENTFHTITSCRAPCNRSTGIAYPIANGPVSFDSGQLGFNYAGFGAPAAGRDTWTFKTPRDIKRGTYTYFCRVHPFMRGSFRVLKPKRNSR